MTHRDRAGGVAAFVAATAFAVGFVMAATALSQYAADDPSAAQATVFVAGHEATLIVWYVVIFIVFGFALVPLVLSLRDRLGADEPRVARAAGAIGTVWAGLVLAAGMIAIVGTDTIADLQRTDPAAAESVWASVDVVESGVGGGVEVVGGVWVLLVSWAGLRVGYLPRALGYLGAVAGAAGAVTLVPSLEAAGAVLGLGMVVWLAGVGNVLISEPSRHPSAVGGSAPTARSISRTT